MHVCNCVVVLMRENGVQPNQCDVYRWESQTDVAAAERERGREMERRQLEREGKERQGGEEE